MKTTKYLIFPLIIITAICMMLYFSASSPKNENVIVYTPSIMIENNSYKLALKHDILNINSYPLKTFTTGPSILGPLNNEISEYKRLFETNNSDLIVIFSSAPYKDNTWYFCIINKQNNYSVYLEKATDKSTSYKESDFKLKLEEGVNAFRIELNNSKDLLISKESTSLTKE